MKDGTDNNFLKTQEKVIGIFWPFLDVQGREIKNEIPMFFEEIYMSLSVRVDENRK